MADNAIGNKDDTERRIAPVPIIDIAPFKAGDDASRRQVADAVAEACEGIGFMMIAGHGIDPGLIEEMYRVSYEFYRLPLEQKMLAASPDHRRHQGYALPGSGAGDNRDERQTFMVQGFDTIADALAAGYPSDVGTTLFPACWPKEPADFRHVYRRYFAAMEDFAWRILNVFEFALGLPENRFVDQLAKHQSSLVSNYYSFETDSGSPASPFRVNPHVDSSIITILYQDDGPGGLQLHQPGMGWRDVRAVDGTYVVNLGSLIERWTNDRFAATSHRVLRPPETETRARLSVPFFLNPALDTVVAPLLELVLPDSEPLYPPVTGRDWFNRVRRNEYDGSIEFAADARRPAAAAP
jgi:isopenicillin N synthase-like dioxygenase